MSIFMLWESSTDPIIHISPFYIGFSTEPILCWEKERPYIVFGSMNVIFLSSSFVCEYKCVRACVCVCVCVRVCKCVWRILVPACTKVCDLGGKASDEKKSAQSMFLCLTYFFYLFTFSFLFRVNGFAFHSGLAKGLILLGLSCFEKIEHWRSRSAMSNTMCMFATLVANKYVHSPHF